MAKPHPYHAWIDDFNDRLQKNSHKNNGAEHRAGQVALAKELIDHAMYTVTIAADPIWDDTGQAERDTSARLLDFDITSSLAEYVKGDFDNEDPFNKTMSDFVIEVQAAIGQCERAERMARAGVLPASQASIYLLWEANDGDNDTPAL